MVLSLGGAFACGDDGPSGCQDNDNDGRGVGCELGDDCDDTNPLRIQNCEFVQPPDCGVDPFQTGCACSAISTARCYFAEAETRDVGNCVAGRVACINGYYGICQGYVGPSFETCDGTDEDCDGRVDEVVESPCGDCQPDCIGAVWGSDSDPFVELGDAVLTGEGALTLRREERLQSYVWIANSGEATLSKVSGGTAGEVARYFSGGAEPSRVAVDYFGDAFVANRQFGAVSTLRKVAGDLERCIDRDGDETITTSTDSTPVPDDECVLWTVDVGEVDEIARALAVDGDRGLDDISGGNVWVGLHDGQAFVEIDGYDGRVLDRIETPGFSPYAAAFDPQGRLWAISRDGYLLSIDRFESPRTPIIRELPLSCYNLYGLAVENDGRIVMTGFDCNDVVLYDVIENRWDVVDTPPSVRGAVVRETGSGAEAWVAHTDGRISVLDIAPTFALRETFSLAGHERTPLETIGIGIDQDGNVFAASSLGGEEDLGVVTRFDAADHVVERQVTVGFAPHTQGDLTGGKLLAGFVPEASQTRVFTGCGSLDPTRWQRVHTVADLGNGGELAIAIRQAEDEAGLAEAEWIEVGLAEGGRDSLELLGPTSVPNGGVVELRITLRSASRDGAPRVDQVGVEWLCEGPD